MAAGTRQLPRDGCHLEGRAHHHNGEFGAPIDNPVVGVPIAAATAFGTVRPRRASGPFTAARKSPADGLRNSALHGVLSAAALVPSRPVPACALASVV